MKMRRSNKVLSLVLASALAVGLLGAVDSDAAKKVALSTKKLTLKVGKSKKLKIKNSKKTKWTVKSGKGKVVLSKKTKKSVVVKGKKAGKAVVAAKASNGKTYKCNVVVKKVSAASKSVNEAPTTAPAVKTAAPTTAASSAPTAVATEAPTVAPTETPTVAPTQTPLLEGQFVFEGLDTSWIDPSKKLVAFTFDDGPIGTADDRTSMIIQKALHDNGCHATFFYIGGRIKEGETTDEIKQAVKYGFEPGNHSWDTKSVSVYEDEDEVEKMEKILGDTSAKLTEVTGYSKFLFRAPNLSYNKLMMDHVGMPMINCAVDSKDWDKATTEQIIENVKKAQDGDIVLMHETERNTAEALPELIKYFHENGFEIVSVSELFAMKNKPLIENYVYDSTTKEGDKRG